MLLGNRLIIFVTFKYLACSDLVQFFLLVPQYFNYLRTIIYTDYLV